VRSLVCLAFLACGATLAHDGHKTERGWQRIDADEPAPAFRLLNQDAKRVALAELRGKPLALTFLYTSCADVCPVLIHALTGVERHLGERERDAVRFAGITVDPKRDTPARLNAFMKERGLDPVRWVLLTGAIGEATKAANDYGVVVRPAPKGDFVHNSVFVVIDAEGRLRAEFHGMATPPEAIAAELRKLIAQRRK
jgi:protein SCO1/2